MPFHFRNHGIDKKRARREKTRQLNNNKIEAKLKDAQVRMVDGKLSVVEAIETEQIMCDKCGHPMHIHINADEGFRCHGIYYDDTIKDSVQCECRLQ